MYGEDLNLLMTVARACNLYNKFFSYLNIYKYVFMILLASFILYVNQFYPVPHHPVDHLSFRLLHSVCEGTFLLLAISL